MCFCCCWDLASTQITNINQVHRTWFRVPKQLNCLRSAHMLAISVLHRLANMLKWSPRLPSRLCLSVSFFYACRNRIHSFALTLIALSASRRLWRGAICPKRTLQSIESLFHSPHRSTKLTLYRISSTKTYTRCIRTPSHLHWFESWQRFITDLIQSRSHRCDSCVIAIGCSYLH